MLFLFLYFLLAMGIFVPIQTIKLRSRTDLHVPAVSFSGLFWFATLSVATGLVMAFSVGYAVMFGPSYITGDFIGLPWLTMLPALGISFWAGARTNRAVLSSLFARANEVAKNRQLNG